MGEKLFHEHKVDLSLWAHEHSYERSWPVFDYQVANGSRAYVNADYTVHIISGAAGCRESHDSFSGTPPSWSAFRWGSYGYGKLQVASAARLHWQFMDTHGAVVDDLVLVKTSRPVSSPSATCTAPEELPKKPPSPEDIQKEQRYREKVFARTRACTVRGAYPQNDCKPEFVPAVGSDELLV